MNIGIIGSGAIGGTAARHFTDAGHEITISNSRGPESLTDLVEELGPNAQAGTPAEAATFGDVVLEAIPYHAYEALPVDKLADTIVISAANYYVGRDGILSFDGRTQTELVAAHLSESTVIKAFNTMGARTLREESRPEADPDDRLALFVAGDDPEAKGVVGDLIDDIGFTAVDTGPLAEGGRLQEPGSPIYTEPMTAGEARSALAAFRTVVVARDRGYYATPREITTAELAENRDLTEQTTLEHLRRGTRGLVDQYLQDP